MTSAVQLRIGLFGATVSRDPMASGIPVLAPPDSRRWFGEFVADLTAGELYTRDGTRVRLQEQPFQVLTLLLERPGQVVTREQFRARLWADGTFVDFEHSLNAAIKRLRVALGDSATEPHYIETVPRRGYRLMATLAPRSVTPAPARRPRLIILPFANLSTAPAYFADGLTEDLIAQVGRRCSPHVGVLARTTSWLYKERAHTAGAVGEALKVDYLVEGSVRCDARRVRIGAKLIETATETQLWADTYDRDLQDCLDVQADVASQIAHAISRELCPLPSGIDRGTSNPAAFDAFLQGRSHWNRPGDAGLDEAMRWYDRAITLDGRFGRAYAARARASLLACEYYRISAAAGLDAARRDAQRALELDAADPEALVSIAEVHRVLHRDWARAEATYRAALDANANSEAAHKYYALFLATRRRPDATAMADRAWHIDPLCSSNNTAAAMVRYFSGDYEGAVERCRITLDIQSGFRPARRVLAAALTELGQYREAIEVYAAADASGLDPVSRSWLGHTLAVSGKRSAARAVLASLEANGGLHVPAFHRAILYAGLGDADGALTALEQAARDYDPALDTLDVDPRFNTLQRRSRFRALTDGLNLGGRVVSLRSAG